MRSALLLVRWAGLRAVDGDAVCGEKRGGVSEPEERESAREGKEERTARRLEFQWWWTFRHGNVTQ